MGPLALPGNRVVSVSFTLFLLMLIVISLSCSSESDEGDVLLVAPEPEEGIDIPYHIPVQPLDIVLIIDQSSSMSGFGNYPPTDPDEWRVKASHYMVSNIAAKRTTYSVPRFGVVHFGTDAPSELSVPLTFMQDDHDVQEINRGIVPLDLNWTNFIDAFREAINLFQKGNTFEEGRKAAVILLTDGEPSDPRNLTAEQYFLEIAELIGPVFSEHDIDLFVIGIDAADMSWSDHYISWLNLLPTENSTIFDLSNMKDLRAAFNEIALVLFDISGEEPELIVDTEERQFEVPAYLERVEFHVFPDDPGLVLNIIRPEGSSIQESDPDILVDKGETFSIIMAVAPEPGTWRYRIEQGRGSIEVYRNLVPVKLRMLQPRSKVILGTDNNILVEFSRQDDTPVLPHPDFPIQIELSLEGPSIAKERLIMEQIEEGLYTVERVFSPLELGQHTFTMEVQAPGALSYTDEFIVEVLGLPYLVPVLPMPGGEVRAGEVLSVEVDVFSAFEPVDFEDHFITRDTALVIAWHKAEGREESSAFYLHPTGKPGRLGGTLSSEVIRDMNQVRFRVVGELIDAEPYIGDELIVEFYGVVPIWVIYGPYVLGIIIIFSGLFFISYYRRPTWSGVLDIENTLNPIDSPGQIELNAFGKKKSLTLGKNAMVPLEAPGFEEINGTIELIKQPVDEFEQGLQRWGIKINYQVSRGAPRMTAQLLQHNDLIQIGPFAIKYFEH